MDVSYGNTGSTWGTMGSLPCEISEKEKNLLENVLAPIYGTNIQRKMVVFLLMCVVFNSLAVAYKRA